MTKLRDVAGVCRFCGCSEQDACVSPICACGFGIPCTWVDRGRRVCTACGPASKAEGHALRTLRRVYPLTDAWRDAFHAGFIAGWFAVTKRSPYGRNPFKRGRYRDGVIYEAWRLGQRHGEDARRIYVTSFGPIRNRPWRSVLKSGGLHGHLHTLGQHRDRRRVGPMVRPSHPPSA